MKISTDEKIKELIDKVKGYIADEDGWKLAKKSESGQKTVNVWYKPSDEFGGHVFKGVGIVDASPETCFKYCDPKPNGKRLKWDEAIKDLEVIEYLRKDDPEMYVMRTMTGDAAKGFISARDFVDMVVNVTTDQFVATLAHNVESDQAPATPEFVRGKNYYCGIVCHRIPGELNQTMIYFISQSDIGGMVPRAIVDSALPAAVMSFYTNLRKQIESDGCQEYSF